MTKQKKFLGKVALLQKDQLEIIEVSLGNDEFVYVREMSGRERETFERSITKKVEGKKGKTETYEGNLEDFRAKVAVCTVCDEKGTLIFKPTDAPQLSMSMKASKLSKIAEAATELNKITDEDKEDLVSS